MRKRNLVILVMFLVCSMVMIFGSLYVVQAKAEQQEETIELVLGISTGVGSPLDCTGKRFSELLKEKTNGKVKVKFYPACQLGEIMDQIQSVMLGSQDMFFGVAVMFKDYAPDFNVLSTAFVFDGVEHVRKFTESTLYNYPKEDLLKYNMRIVANNAIDQGNAIATTKPIRGVDDLKGFKMRVPEIEIYLRNWKSLGARPTVVSWGEVYMALQQGMVEGVDCPFSSLIAQKFYEPASYVTETQHIIMNMIMVINEDKWKSLSPDIQNAIEEAGHEAGEFYSELTLELAKGYEKFLQENGVEVIKLDKNQKDEFAKRLKPLALELEEEGFWREGFYKDIRSLVEN